MENDRNRAIGSLERPPGRLAQNGLHLCVLWAFAVVQPAFDRLAANPTFLTDLRIRPVSVAISVFLIAAVGPLLLLAIEWLAGRRRMGLRRWLHSVFVAALFAVIALPLVCRLRFLPGFIQLGLAISAGAIFATLCDRFAWVRMFVTAASPAVLIFPGVLLFYSPMTRVLFPKSHPMQVSIGNATPVVLIVLDEFCGNWLLDENAQIDRERFQHFAALSSESTWFRNATSVHPATAYAVPAILTGQYQTGDRRPDVVDHPVNLFTLLIAANQYRMTVFESGSRLFPDNADAEYIYPAATSPQIVNLIADLSIVYLHQILPLDQRMMIPTIPRRWFGLLANEDVDPEKRSGVVRYSWDRDRDRQFEHFLNCIQPADEPPFYYFHLVVPHAPWNFLPSGRMYHRDEGMGEQPPGTMGSDHRSWGDDDWAITQGVQRYLLQIGFADYVLGRITERLKRAGLYDECLFVLVADHGVSFLANEPRREPTKKNLADLVQIPLFVKLPHQSQPAIDDRNAETVDVLPTLADFLQMDLPIHCDGESLLSPDRLDRQHKQFYVRTAFESPDAAFHNRFREFRSNYSRFQFAPGWDGLFQVGPNHDLVGLDVSSLNISGPSQLRLELIGWDGSYSNDASEPVPCVVEGRVNPVPESGQPIQLAIAVNGSVRAVTRTYQVPGLESHWVAIIPEHALQYGANALRVFEVRSDAQGRAVFECNLSRQQEPAASE